MIKVDRKEICKYIDAYDSSLKVGAQLGGGGTACVFDLPETEPAQVIKVMDTGCQGDSIGNHRRMRQYFIREILAMKELDACKCKYIMPVLDCYEYTESKSKEESVFLVKMKKMQTLTNYCRMSELTEKQLVKLAMDICRALQTCENQGILHRDVKPDNLFVSDDNGEIYFVLGDFGICRRMDEVGMGTVTYCGTRQFMAPEIEHGEPLNGSFNSDIYSLGVSLYFIASNGKFPFCIKEDDGNFQGGLPDISERFADIIWKAIQLNPKDRFQHASEMLAELEQLSMSDEKMVKRPYFFAAKQAMLRGRFDKALEYAGQGIECEEEGCARLYAYCLYYEYNNECCSDETKAKQAITILDGLAEGGDAIALCLRATIHYKNHEINDFFKKIQKSAENGCIIAQYIYGRSMYKGWHSYRSDPALGRSYLKNAVRANYKPALKFGIKISKEDADIAMVLEQCGFTKDELLYEKKMQKYDIIKFL